MSKIVLVTIVHNRKHLVGQAIQSAVNQTLDKKYWVHLILDNASDDGADKVAEVFAKKYNHIHFVRMGTNKGQMPTYNFALKWIEKNIPEADVLVQLDSDDILSVNALEEVRKKFDSNQSIGYTYSDFNIIGPSGQLKHKRHSKAKQVDPKIELTDAGQKILRTWEIKFNVIGHLRAMRIKALQEIGGFDESFLYATDVNMACRMLSSKYKVAKIPKILYHWREHGKDQVQGEKSAEQTRCWKELCAKYRKLWAEKGLI